MKSNRNEKNICDAYDCSIEATNSIQVDGGDKGKIQLHLCKNCVKMFQDSSMVNPNKTLERQLPGECSNIFGSDIPTA